MNGTFQFAANGEAQNKISPRKWTGKLNEEDEKLYSILFEKYQKHQKVNIDFSWELSSKLGFSDYWWNGLDAKHIGGFSCS